MSKIIVNSTNKGGDGKTTSSINLTEYLALVENKKILCIDLDPQANFSGRYLDMEYDPNTKGGKIPPLHQEYDQAETNWNGRSSIADIFFGEDVFPYSTAFTNIEILPADSERLQNVEAVERDDVNRKVYQHLRTFLRLSDLRKAYDAIIIDTPPSKGPLTKAAIKCASHLIIPAQMEQFSIEGIYGMLQLFKQEAYSRSDENPIALVGILPNQMRDINLHKDFLDHIKEINGIREYVMPFFIKKRAAYAEMLVEGASPKSIFELSKRKKERKEMEEVCKYCTDKIFA
jgi:chromosome partitioning protein